MTTLTLTSKPLTAEAFAPFGDVIEMGAGERLLINEGTAERFVDLAEIDVGAEGGRPALSLARAQPRDLPMTIHMVERHPLGSQAFIPLGEKPFLVLVAAPDARIALADLQAFKTVGRQGINYRPGVWHHPLIALEEVSDFVVIDRGGEGENCDEVHFNEAEQIVLTG